MQHTEVSGFRFGVFELTANQLANTFDDLIDSSLKPYKKEPLLDVSGSSLGRKRPLEDCDHGVELGRGGTVLLHCKNEQSQSLLQLWATHTCRARCCNVATTYVVPAAKIVLCHGHNVDPLRYRTDAIPTGNQSGSITLSKGGLARLQCKLVCASGDGHRTSRHCLS